MSYPAAAVGLIGGRGTAPPGRAALGRRCSAISSTSANGTSVTRGDHAGVVPRSIRAGRPDPGAGLLVAARWSPGLPTGVLRCSPHRSPARVSDPRDPLPRIHHSRAARGVVDVHRRAACPAERPSAPRVRRQPPRGTPSSPPRGARPGAEPPVPSAHAAGPRAAAAPPATGAATLGCRSAGRLLSAAGSRRLGRRWEDRRSGCPVQRGADEAAGDDAAAWSTRAVGSQWRPSGEPVSRSIASLAVVLTGTAGGVPVNRCRERCFGRGVSGCAGGGGGVCGSRVDRGRCGAARPGRGARGWPGWFG